MHVIVIIIIIKIIKEKKKTHYVNTTSSLAFHLIHACATLFPIKSRYHKHVSNK
jgi:hypothetical protein